MGGPRSLPEETSKHANNAKIVISLRFSVCLPGKMHNKRGYPPRKTDLVIFFWGGKHILGRPDLPLPLGVLPFTGYLTPSDPDRNQRGLRLQRPLGGRVLQTWLPFERIFKALKAWRHKSGCRLGCLLLFFPLVSTGINFTTGFACCFPWGLGLLGYVGIQILRVRARWQLHT